MWDWMKMRYSLDLNWIWTGLLDLREKEELSVEL